jgi:ABC-type nitrate/sulfonate/bicarbonate transport system permease component
MTSSRHRRLAFLGLICAVILWQAAPTVGLGSPLYLPTPQSTARAGLTLIQNSMYWWDILTTVRRALTGLSLAALVGIPIGLLLGVIPSAYAIVRFPMDFVRSIPAAALLPLFIVFFGLGDASKVAVVFYGCVFVFLIGALYGARGGSDTTARRQAIRTMGGSPVQEFLRVVVPESLISVAASLRLAASYALVLTIFTEMFLGAEDGLGRRLIDTYLSFRIPEMYFYIVTLGTVGILMNAALQIFEDRYLAIRR